MVDYAERNLNDMEYKSSTVVKTITGEVSNDRTDTTYLQDGDLILLGRTTEDALLGTPIMMIKENFPDGATLDFGYVTYDDQGPIGLDPIHTGVPLSRNDIATDATLVRLPWSSKQVNPDGSEYVGEDGILWGGTAIGAVYHGADAVTGLVDIVIPSTSFEQTSPGTYLTRGA